MLRKPFEKRLRMEMLESKIPMAADVSIAVVDGDLLITGDEGVNSLLIEPAPDFAPGHYFIYNRGQFDDTANGEPFLVFEVTGVTRDVIVNLNGGDDIFRVTGVYDPLGAERLVFPRDLIVNLGEGQDQFYAGVYENFIGFQGPVTVGRNLQLDGGGGDDFVLSTDLRVGNDFTYNDLQGNNIFLNDPSFIYTFGARSSVGGDLRINTGSGSDIMMLEEFDVGGNVAFNLGAGDDAAQITQFDVGGTVAFGLGSGFNTGLVWATDASSVVMGGSGANFIQLLGVNANSITVLTGNNDDIIDLSQVTASITTIATFGGNDSVAITDSAFDLLLIDLGAGNDMLSFLEGELGTGVSTDLAILSGGRGTDTLVGAENFDFDLLLRLAFESF